jgi:hypothetical protein
MSGMVEPDCRADDPAVEIVSVERIWDRAPHNAFTGLARFQDRWYCAFREGDSHVCDNGRLRVIGSADGVDWGSVCLFSWEGGDVRDARLSITDDGRLMLNGAVRFLEPVDGNTHQSVTWLSADGRTWDGPFACPSGLGTWRWSVAWHRGTAYSFGYSGKDAKGCLYRSTDGKSWEPLKTEVFPDEGFPCNESSMIFLDNDTAWCLLRRDGNSDATGMLGVAGPPYTDWSWRSIGARVGGPEMIRLEDGRLLAAVRLYDAEGGGVRTSLGWIDPESARFTEARKLPSGGDTSYAGMVMHDGLLWVSYYSGHEGKTAIYLAKVRIHAAP